MTQNATLFVNAYAACFNGPGALPDSADWSSEFDQELIYAVQQKRSESMVLDNGQSRVLTFPGGLLLTDWHMLILRVIGTGQVQTAGKDADGVTAITASLGVFGNKVLPGILMLSTFNLTSVTIASLADGSVFELFDAKCQ